VSIELTRRDTLEKPRHRPLRDVVAGWISDYGYPGVAIAALLIVWEATLAVFDVPPFFIPRPSDIARALGQGADLYFRHLGVTVYSTLTGFGIAFGTGLILATIVSEVEFLRRTLYPVLIALQSMPRVALAPICIVWFGFGPASRIVLGAISAFFP